MKYFLNAFLVLVPFIVSCKKDSTSTTNTTNNSNAKQWLELGAGMNSLNFNGGVVTICTDNFNNLYAAGDFKDSNGKNYVAKWNGTSWSQLGVGTNGLNANGIIIKITVDKIGNVYAMGQFTNSAGRRYVAQWNGTNWNEVGINSNTIINKYTLLNISLDSLNNLYTLSTYITIFGSIYNQVFCISKWNGTKWNLLDSGNVLLSNTYGAVNNLIPFGVNATGNVATIMNNNLVKWDGSSWKSIPLDTTAKNSKIDISAHNSLLYLNDNIFAGGYKQVVKWNGSSFSVLGGYNYFDDYVVCISDKWGNIYAGSSLQNISKLNSNLWEKTTDISAYISRQPQINLCTDNLGNLYAAGYFTNSAGNYFVAMYK